MLIFVYSICFTRYLLELSPGRVGPRLRGKVSSHSSTPPFLVWGMVLSYENYNLLRLKSGSLISFQSLREFGGGLWPKYGTYVRMYVLDGLVYGSCSFQCSPYHRNYTILDGQSRKL